MERIRKNYICKNQIKKGLSGSRDMLKAFKDGSSIAIMIDQRVSEGKKIPFFDKMALTTTIPAQFVKRFNCKIIIVTIINLKRNIKSYTPNELIFKRTYSFNSIISLILRGLIFLYLRNSL